ncbi:MAG: hypothetical protein C7B43_19675 [Sulfobacillus benefaciens]|uniref:Uncharacterized protein n=1 Tax=Sulfobacillus benefaciens TaxID=453960 RepID=A0A2T2WP49_9FIRM|nr:MAG: hypothetical protein C7B43_19675 [Sulfobacillus benefaciens]
MKSYKKRMGIVFFLLAILTGCGTSPGIGENTLQSKGPGGFPSVVQQVMMSLKAHTTIPLFAPTFVPTGRGYLTATIQPGGVSAKSYHVNMFATKSRVAVNAPSLANGNTTYPEIASFGASRWPSSAQAIRAISAWNADEGLIPQPSEQQHAVALGYHVKATAYTMGNNSNVTSIQWQAGRWLFEVNGNLQVAHATLADAKQIVRFTHQTPFPGSDQAGLVIINYNTVGTHETIQSLVIWTRGPILYHVQTTMPLNALRMAVSMKHF